jgi:hypothetical protein
MPKLKNTESKATLVVLFATVALCALPTMAQSTSDGCAPASVIPLTGSEPPAKLIVHPPLPGPLASRGVAIIEYCAQNLHLVPVFGANALAASPRVGHIHVRLDDAPWVWADASGNPVILMGLPAGTHKVLIELEDANHHSLDKATVTFVVPKGVTE